MTIWHLTGAAITAALLLAWAWWRLRVKSRAIRLDALRWQSAAWTETLREHQRAFTAMDPKYVGRDLIVQVDGPQSHLRHVTEGQALADWVEAAREHDAWARRRIAAFNREYDANICDSRAMAEQRRLDEMEL